MTSESSEPDDDELEVHRRMDRIVDDFEDEPTFEKWRKGGRWT
jgi:hypothetical protein